MKKEKNSSSQGGLIRFAKGIERVGNKLPHPVYLFLGLTLIFMILSAIFSGVTVTYTGAEGEATASVINMFSKKALSTFIGSIQNNYKNLATLSLILLVAIGESVAEYSGFFEALIRKSLLSCPKALITFVLALIGICGNIAGDAGPVLTCTLGCIIYKSIGRNPWLGGITGYVACTAGYSANLIPASTDATLAGITQDIIATMGIQADVHLLSNWIFMFSVTFILAAVVAFVSETFAAKFFNDKQWHADANAMSEKITPEENRGLRYALFAFLGILALVLLCTVPSNGLLRSEDGQLIPKSPFMSAIVPILVLFFIGVGTAYGIGAGTVKKATDVPALMAKGVARLSSMWVLLFFVAQMLYVINASNLATVISVKGEMLLRSIGLEGIPLIIVFIIFASLVNLLMPSASAKWLLLSPIFIPMLYNMGFHPAYTQLAFRIADSCTNAITPLNSALIIAVGILNSYRDPEQHPQEAGVGTVISVSIVFCLAMLVAFILCYLVFLLAGFPIGVGVPVQTF